MIIPPWAVVVVVLVACWRLFLRWRRTRHVEIWGAILNRFLCFGMIYLYFMVDEPPADQRAVAIRWMIATFFLGEIIMSFFSSRGKPHG